MDALHLLRLLHDKSEDVIVDGSGDEDYQQFWDVIDIMNSNGEYNVLGTGDTPEAAIRDAAKYLSIKLPD